LKNLVKALGEAITRFAQQPNKVAGETPQWGLGEGMRYWLIHGTGYSSVSQNLSGHFIIECVGDSWASCNAHDLLCNRQAAFESLLPRQHESYGNKSLAWPVISSYYAAYFSTQSLMRCLGLGTIYINRVESKHLNDAWQARGFPKVDQGNYMFSIELSLPIKIVLRKLGGSGAHNQFWQAFEQSQTHIESVLLTSSALSSLSAAQRQDAFLEFKKLIQASFQNRLSVPPKLEFDWMSNLRNAINYRFENNVWLMNWHHKTGLVPKYEALIARYRTSSKVLPENMRDFSESHLAFVSAKFCQLAIEGSSSLKS
jgi:hypothetical protein